MEMPIANHSTSATQFIEGGGIRFSYRKLGRETKVPIVFFQHFTGNMDNWDPIITDSIAQNREVIIFNNTGVGSTSGQTPDTVSLMADHALAFIRALGLTRIDLFGFSLGGFIAQVIAAKHPILVRKLVLVGTGPEGNEGLDRLPETVRIASSKEIVERMLYMFFTESKRSRNAGKSFLERLQQRQKDRDPESTPQTVMAQMKAIVNWGIPGNNDYPGSQNITQPALIINGGNDRIVPTTGSIQLYRQLTNAQLALYQDAAHGALFQYPELFVHDVNYFLK